MVERALHRCQTSRTTWLQESQAVYARWEMAALAIDMCFTTAYDMAHCTHAWANNEYLEHAGSLLTELHSRWAAEIADWHAAPPLNFYAPQYPCLSSDCTNLPTGCKPNARLTMNAGLFPGAKHT